MTFNYALYIIWKVKNMNPETLQNICSVVMVTGMIVASFGAFGHRHYSKEVDRRKEGVASEQIEKLTGQNNELIAGKDKVVAQNNELKNQNDSLLGKIGILTTENMTIKGIMTNPKLEFLKDRTSQSIDEATGKIKSIYVYRSQYPTVIRNIKVKLTFDEIISRVNTKMPGTLPFANNVKAGFHSDKKFVECFVQQMGEGGELIFEVFSDEPLNIVSNEFSP